MANAAAKKRAASNAYFIQQHRKLGAATITAFLLVRLVVRRSSLTTTIRSGLVPTLVAICIQLYLENIGSAVYDAQKNTMVRGPVADLANAAGVVEWLTDVLYLSWFALAVSALTRGSWGLAVYLVVPCYAAFKLYSLWSTYRGNSRSQEAEPDVVSKRQQKLARRANR